jgi:hypothetical protein
LLSARNDHGLFEFVLFCLGHFLVREAQLVMADGNNVTVLQRMLFDQLAVYVSAVSAIKVFEEGVIQDVNDQGMVSAHRRVVDTDVVIRETAYRVALLGHVVFSQNLVVQAKN